MFDNLTTYQIWAPEDALWTDWAKPVLFAGIPPTPRVKLETAEPRWTAAADYETMVIVDQPGHKGVEEGLALARLGYRPVPLYNGVRGPNTSSCLIKVDEIVDALFQGAGELRPMALRRNAPPAFLLDSNRMAGTAKTPGKFDNRWCVFPQDMPSAAFLTRHGIRKVVVRAAAVQNDLSHILMRYRQAGIAIQQVDGGERVKELSVVKPSRFRSLLYRSSVIAGLVRNPAGGFGGMVPEPTQSSGNVHYYGRVG